jgi:hypothetical protein
MQTDAQDRDAVSRGTLLELDDGTPIVWAGRPTRPALAADGSVAPTSSNDAGGLVVYLATALDLAWTDLPARPLMVPLMQELARQGVGASRLGSVAEAGGAIAVPLGTTELLPLAFDVDAAAGPNSRAGEANSMSGAALGGSGAGAQPLSVGVQPETGLTREPIRLAGVWSAVDDRGQTRAMVNVNPDADGGRMIPQSRPAIGAIWAAAVQRDSNTGDASPASAERSILWLARPGATDAATGVEAPATGAGSGLDSASVTADGLAAVLRGQASQDSPWSMPLLWMLLGLGLVEMVLARLASHASATGSPSFLALAWSKLTQATVGPDAAASLPREADTGRTDGQAREGAAA